MQETFKSDFQPYFKTPVCGAPFSYLFEGKKDDIRNSFCLLSDIVKMANHEIT